MPKPDAYAALHVQCCALGLPPPEREYAFYAHGGRRWRFDFCWPAHRLAIEVEGVVYGTEAGDHRLGGRHTSRAGFVADLEKYRAAFILGWSILRCRPSEIENGSAALALDARLKRGTPHDIPTVPDTSPLIASQKTPQGRRGSSGDRRAWESLVARAERPAAKRR
jgi:hypothetical protein